MTQHNIPPHILNLGSEIINTINQIELTDNDDLIEQYKNKLQYQLRHFQYTIMNESNLTTQQKQTLQHRYNSVCQYIQYL